MQVHKVLTEASMEASRDPVINNFCPEPKDPAVQFAVLLLSPSRGATTHPIISRMIHEHP